MKLGWRDLMAAAGVALVAGGLWMIYPPAALIGAGLAMIGLDILLERRG